MTLTPGRQQRSRCVMRLRCISKPDAKSKRWHLSRRAYIRTSQISSGGTRFSPRDAHRAGAGVGLAVLRELALELGADGDALGDFQFGTGGEER